jgi:phage shock protein C
MIEYLYLSFSLEVIVGKKLYRSTRNRVFLGVCGGLAEYFNTDPVIIRVMAILLLVFGFFPAIIAYLIMAIIMPLEGSTAATTEENIRENVDDIKNTTTNMGQGIRTTFENNRLETGTSRKQPTSYNGAVILGVIIISIGILLLLGNIFGWFWQFFWPAIIIAIGVLLVLLVVRRK